MLIHLLYIYIYDPGFRVRGPPPPPPPNGLGPPRRRERSSRLVCVKASQHALHVYTHTHRLYIHTYILTDKYIHTPIHACTYRHAPPTHRGAGHTIHTHIHTYIQIHTYIHTCMYIQTRPPQPTGGGGGKTTCPPYIQKPVHPDPLGGGGGWGLQPWTIYLYRRITPFLAPKSTWEVSFEALELHETSARMQEQIPHQGRQGVRQ